MNAIGQAVGLIPVSCVFHNVNQQSARAGGGIDPVGIYGLIRRRSCGSGRQAASIVPSICGRPFISLLYALAAGAVGTKIKRLTWFVSIPVNPFSKYLTL